MKTGDLVASAADTTVEHYSWGRLEWMVSGSIGNSTTLTVGQCYIDPGEQNSRHQHPNCDEVLHVLSGSIEYTLADATLPMGPGDSISIPSGTVHNARNTGSTPARLFIAFSTADREVIGE